MQDKGMSFNIATITFVYNNKMIRMDMDSGVIFGKGPYINIHLEKPTCQKSEVSMKFVTGEESMRFLDHGSMKEEILKIASDVKERERSFCSKCGIKNLPIVGIDTTLCSLCMSNALKSYVYEHRHCCRCGVETIQHIHGFCYSCAQDVANEQTT